MAAEIGFLTLQRVSAAVQEIMLNKSGCDVEILVVGLAEVVGFGSWKGIDNFSFGREPPSQVAHVLTDVCLPTGEQGP